MKIITILIVLLVSSFARSESYYMIGNSLTRDAINYGALVDMHENEGEALSIEWHIKGGASLMKNFLEPSVTFAPVDNAWPTALDKDYDYLVLQPHEDGTTQAEIDAIELFSTMTSAKIVIYETFPRMDKFDIAEDYYNLPAQNNFIQSKAEYKKIRDAFPDAIIVPFMQVFVDIDNAARAGKIDGISSAKDLYSDRRHLNDLGKFAIMLTFLKSMTGADYTQDMTTKEHDIYRLIYPKLDTKEPAIMQNQPAIEQSQSAENRNGGGSADFLILILLATFLQTKRYK
jgi:hypothetical protein